MAQRVSHLPSHPESSILLEMQARGELCVLVRQPGRAMTAKMLIKGWVERSGPRDTFRITVKGQEVLRAKLPK